MRYGDGHAWIAILGLPINQPFKGAHMAIGKTGRAVITGANDTYHGIKSLEENGPINHAAAYARLLVAHGKAKNEDDALLMANQEVQRIRGSMEGEQLNRAVRMALRPNSGGPKKWFPLQFKSALFSSAAGQWPAQQNWSTT
jgi:hypothetical protein